MADIRRREPTNIGVVLLTTDGPRARFRGEVEPGTIDGRLVRGHFGSLDNYKGWVDYWRMAVMKGDPLRLLIRDPQQNYFLEFGGERVLGNVDLDSNGFLDELYRELVEDAPLIVDAIDPRRLIERTFLRLNIRERIENRPAVVDRAMGVDDPLDL